jgi:hypothetical protein
LSEDVLRRPRTSASSTWRAAADLVLRERIPSNDGGSLAVFTGRLGTASAHLVRGVCFCRGGDVLGGLSRRGDGSRRVGAWFAIAVSGAAGLRRSWRRPGGWAGWRGLWRVRLGRLGKALGSHRVRGTVIEHGREIDAPFSARVHSGCFASARGLTWTAVAARGALAEHGREARSPRATHAAGCHASSHPSRCLAGKKHKESRPAMLGRGRLSELARCGSVVDWI